MGGDVFVKELDLTVIIPSLNEAPNLKRLVPLLQAALEELAIRFEILVVDGNSADGTQEVVTEAGATYLCEGQSGYGNAIQRGIAEACGHYIITMDADLSHPAAFIQQLWQARDYGDIVIASRYVLGGHADQPWGRLQLSRILNGFFRFGLSIPAKDLSSGFRLYRRNLFESIDLKYTNFVILLEILLKAYGRGMQIQEVPFHYASRTIGSSKARIISFGKDYLRLFYQVWRYRNSVDFPDYDWRAHNSRIPLQRYWQRKRHRIILDYARDARGVICDVGCGSSHILDDLPRAIGVDLRHDKLAFMRRTEAMLVQATGLTLPFPDAHFECVICSEVIEHIPDENGKLIDELTRILKPGGTLILGTPDYGRWEWRFTEWLYKTVKPDAYGDEHVTFYTAQSLTKALMARGYRVLGHDYICRGELIIQARKSK